MLLAFACKVAKAIKLNYVSHYTTLKKAAKRMLVSDAIQLLLEETAAMQMGRCKCVSGVASDFCSHISLAV